MPEFGSSFTRRTYAWSGFKAVAQGKNLAVQYEVLPDTSYLIWGYDGPEVHACIIWTGSVPTDILDAGLYTQDQNDADRSDFETNLKPSANAPIELRSADGRTVVRMTTASKAKNFNLRIFSFVAGDSSTLVNQDSNYNALSDITMTCYDGNGAVTTNSTQAVKSVLDMEPHFNFEVIGGWIDTPPTLLGGTTGSWWISCVGVPDIPAAYGGSVNFVYPANLEIVYTQKIVSDGRASQYLLYNATYHTNKIRWIMKHPVSANAQVQIYVETFT